MQFIANEIYLSRDGREYVYCERRSNVHIFKTVDLGESHVVNINGRWRWDDVDHPSDIIGKK
jgi:hypothetical protein